MATVATTNAGGYGQYKGIWFPLAAFTAGAIIGWAFAEHPVRYGGSHVEWCANQYRGHRLYENTISRITAHGASASPLLNGRVAIKLSVGRGRTGRRGLVWLCQRGSRQQIWLRSPSETRVSGCGGRSRDRGRLQLSAAGVSAVAMVVPSEDRDECFAQSRGRAASSRIAPT